MVRIEDGVPAMGAELSDKTIPAEAGQAVIDASVSFTKGCYTGQELVARVDSRGNNVPRQVRALVLAGAEAPPALGAEVTDQGKAVGAITSIGLVTRRAAPDRPRAAGPLGRGPGDRPGGDAGRTAGGDRRRARRFRPPTARRRRRPAPAW